MSRGIRAPVNLVPDLDLDLPVLPPEWRRVRRASLEELLQFGRWNDPAARAHRRELDLTPGYRCDVEFVLK